MKSMEAKQSISGSNNTNFTELLQDYEETSGVWTFFIWLLKNQIELQVKLKYLLIITKSNS